MSTSSATDLHVESPPEIPLEQALEAWRNEAKHSELDTGRYRCRYFVWGAGPPIVFIHGLCDRARSFVPVMSHLRNAFQCIGYELPEGDGDGARLQEYRHRDLALDLVALFEHLRLERSYLFGSSFGTTIALTAMREFSPRIPRAVLQGGFARRPLTLWEKLLMRLLRHWRGKTGTLPFRRRLHPGGEHRIFRDNAPGAMWDFLLDNSNDVARKAVGYRGRMIDEFDDRARLAEVRQPILLIHGTDDRIVPAPCGRDLIQGLPNAAEVMIPNCGHYPQYTHPALTAELMRQFFTAPTCSPADCDLGHSCR